MTLKESTVTTKTATKKPTKAEAQTLAELEALEAQAMGKVAEVRAAAARARQEEMSRQQAAQAEHDRQMLAAWPQEKARLQQEIDQAHEAFRAAVLADPVWAAYRQRVLAEHRLRTLWLDTSSASARVGSGSFAGAAPPIAELDFDILVRMVSADAEEQGRAEQQARADGRENAGQA